MRPTLGRGPRVEAGGVDAPGSPRRMDPTGLGLRDAQIALRPPSSGHASAGARFVEIPRAPMA